MTETNTPLQSALNAHNTFRSTQYDAGKPYYGDLLSEYQSHISNVQYDLASNLSPDLVQALYRALEAIRNNPTLVSAQGKIETLSMDECMSVLQTVMDQTDFDDVTLLATTQPFTPGTNFGGILPSAITLTGALDLSFILGGSLGMGIAIDITSPQHYAWFVTGSGSAGEEEEIEVDLQIGLCSATYDQVSGFMIGAAAGLDVVAGATVAASCGIKWGLPFPSPDYTNWAVGVSADIGEGEEIDGFISWTHVIRDMVFPKISQPDAPYLYQVSYVHCIDRAAEGSQDHIRLEFTLDDDEGAYRFPVWDHYTLGDDDHWYMNRTMQFSSSCTVNLYDDQYGLIDTKTFGPEMLSVGADEDYDFGSDTSGVGNTVLYHVNLKRLK